MSINYETESREDYVKRLQSYENTPMSYDQTKEALSDWIEYIKVKSDATLKEIGEHAQDIGKQVIDQTIYNEVKKIMLISLFGYENVLEAAKTIKEFDPLTLLDEIEKILSEK